MLGSECPAFAPSTRDTGAMPFSASSISVLIPHYGDAGPTERLARQLVDERAVHEVIVVDDHSPVPLPKIPGARVIRREINGGFGAAVNTAAAAANGDLLLIVNSDVTICPGFVSQIVEAAALWQPALVAPAIRTAGTLEHTARRFPRARYMAFERVHLLARFRRSDWWARNVGQDLRARPGSNRSVDWVAGVCLLLPHACFDLVGGFDERFFMYAEEVDLQKRLASVGIPRVYLGCLSVDHIGGASSDPARAQRWLSKSRITYAAKWGGIAQLRVLLTIVALVNAANSCIAAHRGA